MMTRWCKDHWQACGTRKTRLKSIQETVVTSILFSPQGHLDPARRTQLRNHSTDFFMYKKM